MAYTCPRHNCALKFWDNSGTGKPNRYTCPTKLGTKNGKNVYCDYGSSDEFKALLAQESGPVAPAAPARTTAPAAPRAADQGSGGPRVQAAIAALQAAATVYQGMGQPPSVVMSMAAEFYHRFLKPAFMGELPKPQESDFGPGPDDDIPF